MGTLPVNVFSVIIKLSFSAATPNQIWIRLEITNGRYIKSTYGEQNVYIFGRRRRPEICLVQQKRQCKNQCMGHRRAVLLRRERITDMNGNSVYAQR